VVEELGWVTQLAVKLRMLVAPPWQRVRKGSVLTMKLRGEVGGLLLYVAAATPADFANPNNTISSFPAL
jgi:hypothetical protein